MKKVKLGFGEGGFQGFMARHIEKCVLVTVILLMAYFIYSGSSATSLDGGSLTQEKMKQDAARAESQISDSKWTNVAGTRNPGVDFGTKGSDATVDGRFYANRPWDPLQVPRLQPRTDPALYAPENLQVIAIRAPLVLAGPQQSQEVTELPEDPLEKFPVTVGGGGQYGAYGGSPDGAAGGAGATTYPGSSPDGPTGKKPSRREKAKAKGPGGATPYPGSDPYGQQPRRGRNRKTDEASPYAEGATPYGAGMTGAQKPRAISPEATMGVKATPGSELRPAYAMIVNASVDFAKQWQAYRDAFSSAPGGQDPSRDVPVYIAVWAQRADVTDNPDVAVADIPEGDGGWTMVDPAALKELEPLYGQEVPELSDPEAIERRFTQSGAFVGITRMVPPFLLTDLAPALTHPDVPRAASPMDEYIEEEFSPETIKTREGEIPLDMLEGGSEGGAGGRYPGSGSGYGRGAGAGASTPYGRGRGGSTSYGRGAGAGAGAGAGTSYGGGRSYGGAGEGGNVDFETYRPVPKKLVRYVDFTAKPGRKYRYRLKVVLQDPNHPAYAADAPDMTSLDEKARQRVRAQEVKDAASKSRTYWIGSEWSEPTQVVSLPSNEQFYAGSTSRPGTSKINGVDVVTTEPQAKVLTVQWDDKLGVFAPTEQTVSRASVLNAKADVEVIHPILGDLRKIEGYAVRTDGIVLDMVGGDNLPGADKEPQKAPGETLVLDAEGNLIVTDEADDSVGYRKYIFPEPKEEPVEASAAGSTPDMGEAMLPPGYPGTKRGRPRPSRD